MAQAHVQFDKRLKRIVKNHDRIEASGAKRVVNSDGLIVARPRLYSPRFPLAGIVMLVVIGFLFKGYVYADMGAETYNARVAGLQQGNIMEKAGAWVMQADPATLIVSQVFGAAAE